MAAEASLRTSIDSISPGFRPAKPDLCTLSGSPVSPEPVSNDEFGITTPSITYIGLPPPRIDILMAPPGCVLPTLA